MGKQDIAYMQAAKILKERHRHERNMRRIPATLSNGDDIALLASKQDVLVKKVILDLCSLYAPAGRVLSVSDGTGKWAYFDDAALKELGIDIAEHGKMPNVVVHHVEKDWLVLIEAVTSHGPVNPKRRRELKELFAGSKIGLVFVTAFLERRAMIKYLNDISWETEVWVAESPTHLIHFNGERFLGPYED